MSTPAARPVYLPPREENLRRFSVYNTVRFIDRIVLRVLLSVKCTGAERIPEAKGDRIDLQVFGNHCQK